MSTANNINDFIYACVNALLETDKVTIVSKYRKRTYKSTLIWDPNELIYRFKGELSKQINCNAIHRSICRAVMINHMRQILGIKLIDNGPNSACPVIMNIDQIVGLDGIEV